MSDLKGAYVIYNRVLDSSGKKLAMTYNGNSELVTVKALSGGTDQQVYFYKINGLTTLIAFPTSGY